MARKSSKRYFLVHVYGSTDPSVIGKSHASYDSLLKAARKFVSSGEYTEGEDGVFYLVTQDRRRPEMCSFTSDELEDGEGEGEGEENRE